MTLSSGPSAAWSDAAALAQSRRGNRRRLWVFLLVFALVMLAGQAWNLSRADQFRSSLRLQLDLPDAAGRAERAASATYGSRLQLVDSRPVLARLAEQLHQAGVALPPGGEADLQALLSVHPVPGSDVLEVQATGPDPQLLFRTLDLLPAVLRGELAGRQSADADDRLARAQEELARLDRQAHERRVRLDQFRQRAGVLAERDENEVVASNKALTLALNNAVDKEATANARLRALTDAAAEGRVNTNTRQDPTLAALEARAHQAREELKELERSFTPAFLAMDPRARAVRARLTELEGQITRQRDISQNAALQAAREDLATAQAQVARVREKQGAARPSLGLVSTRLAEAKVLEDDLAEVEKTRRERLAQVAQLQSDERRRVAKVEVVEAALLPTVPVSPDRWRDGAWVTAAAVLAAVLAMMLVEVFNRPPVLPSAPVHTTLVVTPGLPGLPGGAAADLALGAGAAPAALGQGPGPSADSAPAAVPAALAAPTPRLRQDEAAALLSTTTGTARLACALGLLGLNVDEALALRQSDLTGDRDGPGPVLQVGGAWARAVVVPGWLATQIDAMDGPPTQALLADASGQPLQAADLQALLLGVALDAGLPHAALLSWDALRATGIDWLVASGVKYSDLPRHVGRVDAALLAALAQRRGDLVDAADGRRLMPALRLEPKGA